MEPKLKSGDKVTSCANHIIGSIKSIRLSSPTKCKDCIDACGIIYTIANVEEATCEGGYRVMLVEQMINFNKPKDKLFEQGGAIVWFNKVNRVVEDLPPKIMKTRFELLEDD